MADKTGISWTEATWNPTTGCDKVSPGCGLPRFDGDDTGGCYAMAMAARLKKMGSAKYQKDGDPRTSGPGFGVTTHEDTLDQPLRWTKPRRIFVNSMSDLFHADIPDEFISRVFDVMEQAPRHTFQVLTKRHARMRSFARAWQQADADYAAKFDDCPTEAMRNSPAAQWARRRAETRPAHIWLGNSVEDQKWADIRIPALLETPAGIRFLSCEPLLGEIDFRGLLSHGIDWVIVGGESGPDHRVMNIDWLAWIAEQCKDAGVALWVKQDSGLRSGSQGRIPDDFFIQEFPATLQAVSA